jgi:hypothetical protein
LSAVTTRYSVRSAIIGSTGTARRAGTSTLGRRVTLEPRASDG